MPKISQPFVTFKDGENLYLLQVEFPHYKALVQSVPNEKALIQIQVPMYRIYIVFAGTLAGNLLHVRADYQKELDKLFLVMSDWYLEHRISKFPERFKKAQI